MPSSVVFRQKDGRIQMGRKTAEGQKEVNYTWCMNFILTIDRIIRSKSSTDNYSGFIMRVVHSDPAGGSGCCYIPAYETTNQDRLRNALAAGIPNLDPLLTNFNNSSELKQFLDEQIQLFKSSHDVELLGPIHLHAVDRLGWTDGTYIMGFSTQVTSKGSILPRNKRTFIVLPEFDRKSTQEFDFSTKGNGARKLFVELRRILDKTTYLTSLFVAGSMLMAVHYERILSTFSRCPMTVLVGGVNTGKSLLSKIGLSLLNLHQTGIYKTITEAKIDELLSETLAFVYNDPGHSSEIKELIMKTTPSHFERTDRSSSSESDPEQRIPDNQHTSTDDGNILEDIGVDVEEIPPIIHEQILEALQVRAVENENKGVRDTVHIIKEAARKKKITPMKMRLRSRHRKK